MLGDSRNLGHCSSVKEGAAAAVVGPFGGGAVGEEAEGPRGRRAVGERHRGPVAGERSVALWDGKACSQSRLVNLGLR